MGEFNLQNFMKRHSEHEAMCTRLSEELGVLHGLSWADFVLLAELDVAGGTQTTFELAQKLGLSRSRFLLQLIPLEKIGLVERTAGEKGARRIALRPAGRRQQREAWSTAAEVCRAMLAEAATGRSLGSSGDESSPEFR
jgi:DNA-binding MarR family transcriptional regulator